MKSFVTVNLIYAACLYIEALESGSGGVAWDKTQANAAGSRFKELLTSWKEIQKAGIPRISIKELEGVVREYIETTRTVERMMVADKQYSTAADSRNTRAALNWVLGEMGAKQEAFDRPLPKRKKKCKPSM
jgi:hypothetical protein